MCRTFSVGEMNVKNQGRRLKKMKAGGPPGSLADLIPVKKNTGERLGWPGSSTVVGPAEPLRALQSVVVPAAGAARVRATVSCPWKGLTDCHSV